jgi:site-specific recombinase XerD
MRQYEVHNKTEGKSAKTVSWYNELLGLFHDWLTSQKLPTTLGFMNEEIVRLFILDLQERPGLRGPKMSSHSVANRVGGLRTFFGWLFHKGYTEFNLLEDLKVPKKAELIIEPLTSEEVNQLFASINSGTALGARNTAVVSLMLDTGLRVSEEANLKEDDVHLDSRYVKVMGKGFKERMISFGVSCQRTLLQYYHYFRPEPAHPGVDTFFLSIDGYPMTTSSIQSMMKRLAKSSGVPRMYPHLLRHTYATLFLLNGGDVCLQRPVSEPLQRLETEPPRLVGV